MTSAVITRVQRDSVGNLTTDSTGQPLPEGAKSAATSWTYFPDGGSYVHLPEGAEVWRDNREHAFGCQTRKGESPGQGLSCTRAPGHEGPHRAGVGGQSLTGEWAIPVDPEPSTRINLDYTSGNGNIVIPFTREQIEEHVTGPANHDISAAIRTALIEQLGCTGRNDGHARSSIKVLDDEPPVSLDTHVGNRVAEVHTAPVQAELDKVKAEFDAFKLKVAEVGERYAKEHGLCSVYDSVIEELGLTRPVPEPETYEFDLTVTLKVRGTPSWPRQLMDERWIHESIRWGILEDHIKDSGNTLAKGLLDTDWDPDATEIRSVFDIAVDNVQKVAA